MRLLLTLLFLSAFAALAQEPPPPPQLEPVPDSPVGVSEDDGLQPEVTIIRREEAVIEEHRINGRLYMVRVVPRKGLPYYLLDTDGDGSLETRRNDLAPDVAIPGWVIMSWD